MFKNFGEVISSYFKSIKHYQIPLLFEMDMNEEGEHLVQVFLEKETGKERIVEVEKLWNYGLNGDFNLDESHDLITLSEEDRQTLYSLKSLNPEILQDGTLKFDIAPPVLKYLRKKKNLAENESSQKLKISEDPLKPTVNIDYEPGEAMEVRAGYSPDGDAEIVPAADLNKTSDGKYVRFKNLFVPLEEVGGRVKKYLDEQVSRIKYGGIPEFILRDLVLIKSETNAVLTDLAENVRVIEQPLSPSVKVDKGETGWLNFQVEYEIKGHSFSQEELESYKAEKYFSVDENTFVAVDRQSIENTRAFLDKLEAEQIKGENAYRLPATKFSTLEEFIDDIGGYRKLSQAYEDFLSQLKGFETNQEFYLGERFENRLDISGFDLRPYQRGGIHWLDWLRSNHLHGVLADDMGLGKTLQSICAVRLGYKATESSRHSLVIAPKSVLYHWEREIQRCYPGRRTYVYHGPKRRESVLKSSLPHMIITTYATASRDIDILSEVPFYYLILDEATKIKNPSALRTQAIKALNATHRLALSGTPVENRPAELWSLFDFLMRGHLGKMGTFVRVFEDPIMAGDSKKSEILGTRISPFLLRRTKKQVAKDLPEKFEIKDWCELTDEQQDLYVSLQSKTKDVYRALKRGEHVNYTKSILPVLTWLKQICDHPALYTEDFEPVLGRSNKFDWIIDKVDEIVSDGDQVVIFSHFLDMLNLLELSMKRNNYSYIRIDGSTNNRQPLIDAFNAGKARVALLSLMAAGHGINMTAANHVIHADRWWNPAIEDQATDRVHRIGQEQTVFVYNILVENTLEERIDRLLEKKRGISDQIIGSATRGDRKWSKQELIELLRPL